MSKVIKKRNARSDSVSVCVWYQAWLTMRRKMLKNMRRRKQQRRRIKNRRLKMQKVIKKMKDFTGRRNDNEESTTEVEVEVEVEVEAEVEVSYDMI